MAILPLPEAAGPSMAMIINGGLDRLAMSIAGNGFYCRHSRQIGAQRSHQFDEARKARADEAAIVDAHRAFAGQSQHERRHGNAVIHVSLDEAAAGNTAAALHEEIVAFGFRTHAV